MCLLKDGGYWPSGFGLGLIGVTVIWPPHVLAMGVKCHCVVCSIFGSWIYYFGLNFFVFDSYEVVVVSPIIWGHMG